MTACPYNLTSTPLSYSKSSTWDKKMAVSVRRGRTRKISHTDGQVWFFQIEVTID